MEHLTNIKYPKPLKIFKFGNCYLNTSERKLFKNKTMLDLPPKAFDILILLVNNSGEIVSKDELLNKIWGESYVEEGNLPVHISKIRKILNANKNEPYIETVSGMGYRFVSRVYPVNEVEWENKISDNNSPHNIKEESEPDFDSIAVFPLKNENGDEEIEYLADGITESIINNLSYFPNLRILSRNAVFRYKNKDIDIQEIEKKLGASLILTGRIRMIRENLIISVELINAVDESQIWGTHFNQPLENIFEIQEKITEEILGHLKTQIPKINNSSVNQKITQNAESYKLYLKGKYLINKKSFDEIIKAQDFFKLSILQDPTNAHSYIGLADGYRLLYIIDKLSYRDARDKVSPLLDNAAKINPSIPEIYEFNGYAKLFWDWDIKGSEKNFNKAIELNPNSINAHYRYSVLLMYCGKFVESLKHLNECTKQDPISVQNNKNIARLLIFMEQFDNALTKINESLELEPKDFETLLIKGFILAELKEYDKALQHFQDSLEMQYKLETVSLIGYTNALAGNVKEAKENIKKLKEKTSSEIVPSIYLAIIYAALGETDQTFKYLEKSYKEHYSDLMALKVDPRFKSIRNDPRYDQMLKKVGLPIK